MRKINIQFVLKHLLISIATAFMMGKVGSSYDVYKNYNNAYDTWTYWEILMH